MENHYEKRGYLLEDFRLFHLQDAQGTKIDFHYHEFCKLLLLRSGSGSYSVEGQRYTLIPGDIVLIGSRCVHRPEFEAGVPYERSIIYISPAFLRRQSTEDCALEDCFSGLHGHVLRPSQPLQRRLFAIADELEQELSGKAYGRVILSSGMLLRLLVEIGRAMQNGDDLLLQPMQPHNNRVLDILRYLDTHLTEDITIDDLAEKFYLSKYHMMRLFRRETGETIHNYLSLRRLLYARDLIEQGMTATEACFRCGWQSYSSFTRAYAKRFGTTPTGRTDCTGLAEETFE